MDCALQASLPAQLGGDDCFFIARQPLYNNKLEIFGYELLYRAKGGGGMTADICGNQATASVLGISLTEMGISALVEQHTAFVNMTRWALMSEQVFLLPPDRVVLEVLEDVEPDAALINRLRELAAAGYRLALDDFIYHRQMKHLVKLASVIKLDIQSMGREHVVTHLKMFQRMGIKVLVEKVETWEELEFFRTQGADYFQGYFLARPQTLCGRKAPYNQRVAMELLSRLHDPEVSVRELTALISQDAFLSYRLLRYLNSAAFGLARKVSSIQNAIVLLGLKPLRALVTLLWLVRDNQHPPALAHLLLTRAKFCELVAQWQGHGNDSTYFTVGMLSMLHLFLARPLPELLAELPLSDEVVRAVLQRDGPAGQVLTLVEAIQNGKTPTHSFGELTEEQIHHCYQEALVWATASIAQLGNP